MTVKKIWLVMILPLCLCLCGCYEQSTINVTYAQAQDRLELILYDIQAPPVEEPVVVEEQSYEELVEANFIEMEEQLEQYENLDAVYPEPEEYAQENYEDTEFVSYEEWTWATASAYSVYCNYGTSTASGIPLDDYTPTVASKWLPLGSYIEIVYNGASVTAQVTDRGPYVDGRDLDLSLGTINALGIWSTDDWGVRDVQYHLL